MSILLLQRLVFAGAVTDGPGAMHGNVGIRSQFQFAYDELIESETNVGMRDYSSHTFTQYIEFAPIRSLSVSLSLPIYQEKYHFRGISNMEFAPTLNTGSYLNSEPSTDLERSGFGVGGATIGVYLYPFHNRLWEERADRGAWKLGIAYRFGAGQHFYTSNDAGNRGAGPGSSAFQFYGAFSSTNRTGSPYAEILTTSSGVWTGDIRDDEGNLLVSNAELRPASSVDLRVGNEFTLWEDTAFAHFVELDLYSRFNYESWADLPSGVLLPNTLKAYDTYVINRSEVLRAAGGLGTNIQYNSYYHARLAVEAGYMSPQSIEHLYPISTNGTFHWGLLFEFRFRYRTTAT